MSTRQQKSTGYGLQPSNHRASSNHILSNSMIQDSQQSLRSTSSAARIVNKKRTHQPFVLDLNQANDKVVTQKTHLQSQLSHIEEDSPTQNTSGTFGSDHGVISQIQNSASQIQRSFGQERQINNILNKNQSGHKNSHKNSSPWRPNENIVNAITKEYAKTLVSPSQCSASSDQKTPSISAVGRQQKRFGDNQGINQSNLQASNYTDQYSQDDGELTPSMLLPPQATQINFTGRSKVNSQECMIGAHLLKNKEMPASNCVNMFQTPTRPDAFLSSIETQKRNLNSNIVLSSKASTVQQDPKHIEKINQTSTGHFKNLISFGYLQQQKLSTDSDSKENPISFAVQSLKEAYATDLSAKDTVTQPSPVKQTVKPSQSSPIKARNSSKPNSNRKKNLIKSNQKQQASPKVDIINPRLATSPQDKSKLHIKDRNFEQLPQLIHQAFHSNNKGFMLQVQECMSQQSSALSHQANSPAKLLPFFDNFMGNDSSYFNQSMSKSPSKIVLQPVPITQSFIQPSKIECKPEVQKESSTKKKQVPSLDVSPAKKALTQSRERLKRKQNGDEPDERLVQAMIENLRRLNQEEYQVTQKQCFEPKIEMPNLMLDKVQTQENFETIISESVRSKPSQERRKRSQRLGGTQTIKKSTNLVQDLFNQEKSKNQLQRQNPKKINHNCAITNGIKTTQKRDQSNSSVNRKSSTTRQPNSQQQQTTLNVKSKSKVSELMMLNTSLNGDQFIPKQNTLQQSTLNLTIETSMNIPQTLLPSNTLEKLKENFPSPDKYQDQVLYEITTENEPIEQKPVVQAQVYQQPQNDEISPFKQTPIYLKQTASSKLKSREPSARQFSQKSATRGGPSQLSKSPPKARQQTISSFKKESPVKIFQSQSQKRQNTATLKAKLEILKKNNSAKKIQKAYRQYRQHKLEVLALKREQEAKALALKREQEAKAILNAQIKLINLSASKIQHAYQVYMTRQRLVKSFQKLRHRKSLLNNVILAWRTRRALNCLGTEVQDFVNCEDNIIKSNLRNKFHKLFETVLRDKLYLEINARKLQTFVFQTEQKIKMAQKPVVEIKVIQKMTQNEKGSPFKKSPSKKVQKNQVVRKSIEPEPISKSPQRKVLRDKNKEDSGKPGNQHKQSIEKMYTSCESMKSFRSVDQRVISELKQFIRNSSDTNLKACDSICSIHVGQNFVEANQVSERSKRTLKNSLKNIQKPAMIENIAITENCLSQEDSARMQKKNSRYDAFNKLVPVPNIVNAKKNYQSSRNLNKSLQNRTQGYTKQTKTFNKSFDLQKAETNSQENVMQKTQKKELELSKHAVGYKSKIQKVRARVDCWNRSVSKDVIPTVQGINSDQTDQPNLLMPFVNDNESKNQTTVKKDVQNGRSSQSEIRASCQYVRDMVKIEAKEKNDKIDQLSKAQKVEETTVCQEKPRQMTHGSVSNLKKPTPNPVQKNPRSRQVYEPYCDTPVQLRFANDFSDQINSIQKQKMNDTRYVKPSQQKSSSCGPTAKSKANALQKAESKAQTIECENVLTQAPQLPCSFNDTQPKPQPAPQQPMYELSKSIPQTQESAKHYSPAVIQTPVNTRKTQGSLTGSHLRQFITGNKRTSVASRNIVNNAVKEAICDLNSLMDNLTVEAESTQQKKRRQKSQSQMNKIESNASIQMIPGMRTEQRAQIQAVKAAEKNFKKLVATLESHFEVLKSQLLPAQQQLPQETDL